MRISDWSSDVCSSDLRFVGAPESAWLGLFRAEAVSAMMDMIREDLAKLGIHHDLFSSEAELQAEGQPAAAENWLTDHDLVYVARPDEPSGPTPADRDRIGRGTCGRR